MTLKNRLAQLEKKNGGRPSTPQIIETWGACEDGTKYLISTWKQLIDADEAGHLNNCPEWQRFINDESTEPNKTA